MKPYLKTHTIKPQKLRGDVYLVRPLEIEVIACDLGWGEAEGFRASVKDIDTNLGFDSLIRGIGHTVSASIASLKGSLAHILEDAEEDASDSFGQIERLEAAQKFFSKTDQPPHEDPFESLEQMKDLKANWDSYGAPPIKPDSIAFAESFLRKVPAMRVDCQVSPGSNGNVTLEWYCNGYELDLEFKLGGEIDGFYREADSDV